MRSLQRSLAMDKLRIQLSTSQVDLCSLSDTQLAVLAHGDRPVLLTHKQEPPSWHQVNSWLADRQKEGREVGRKKVKKDLAGVQEVAHTKEQPPGIDWRGVASQTGTISEWNSGRSSEDVMSDRSALWTQDTALLLLELDQSSASSSGQTRVQRKLNFQSSISSLFDEEEEEETRHESTLSTATIVVEESVLLSSGGISKPSTKLKDDASLLGLSRDLSCIQGITPNNTCGFKYSQQSSSGAETRGAHEYQHLTLLSMELHTHTRQELRSDPDLDPICAIVYTIYQDSPQCGPPHTSTGVMLTDPPAGAPGSAARNWNLQTLGLGRVPGGDGKTPLAGVCVTQYNDETHLMQAFVELVQLLDPDILVGYEIQMQSWGYLLQRAHVKGLQLNAKLSRIPDSGNKNRFQEEDDPYGADHMSEIHIVGRIVLNLWRILRHEVTLNVYTFENAAFHILHERIPQFSYATLTPWYKDTKQRWRTLQYYVIRSIGNIRLLLHLDLVSQTSEFARVFGIEFYHVLSRGSQYRVESMMMRTAKQQNMVAVSPSVQQRAHQRAPECIPLNLEPESRLYTDPVVVLDFQSLYPSVMIAYNYCYSTCLGRLEALTQASDGRFPFGCTSLEVATSLLEELKDDVTICPNGVCFVKPHIRKGIISQLVEGLLMTRIMVKKSMKKYQDHHTLSKLLHARQLGLKLIANVTFGYTAATFSGRMPCVEIGDSIVRKSRETLERAIKVVNEHPTWNVRVVYGDTDSMFILMPGKSKAEAFSLGQEIADEITALNPKPVKLKFEKVYQPCVLQTKKRYVGFMYETPDQLEPVFDAKGIETVRRDNCTIVSKILEKSIRLLFSTLDISLVKQYVQRQCSKLLDNRSSIQDCVIAKEYRGRKGYRPTACVPALEIAKRRLQTDRRAEPRVGERVPYVVVCGTPGLPLIRLVREPHEVLRDPQLRINATYYLTKQVLPPLHRIMSLIGVDVFPWYNDIPKTYKSTLWTAEPGTSKKATISQYFSSTSCLVCGEVSTNQDVCTTCQSDPQRVALTLSNQIRLHERQYTQLTTVCNNCMRSTDSQQPCISIDCPVLYRRIKCFQQLGQSTRLKISHMLDF